MAYRSGLTSDLNILSDHRSLSINIDQHVVCMS